MKLRALPTLPLLGMSLALLPDRVAALDAEDVLYYRFGPLSIKPQAGLSEIYNDNIFYLPNNTVSDFITMVSPGLKLDLGRPNPPDMRYSNLGFYVPDRNYFSLAYQYDQLFYADNPTIDTGQHSINISDRLIGQRLSLSGTDRLQFLSSPLGGVERIITARNISRNIYDDNYLLNYDVSEKTAAYLRATHSEQDFQSGIPLYSADTLTGTAGFGYRAFPKTSFFGEVYYGQSTTSPESPQLPTNPDVSFVGGYVGARGNFTQKLIGVVKVGYEERQFSDGSSAPSQPVVDMSLTEHFTEKQALTLSYSHQNNVSLQFTRETFTADIVGLQFSQALGSRGKWTLTASPTYAHYGYDFRGATVANYDNIRGTLGLAYKIQLWLTASLAYDFERLTGSQNGTLDYTVNRVTFRMNVGF